MPTNDIVVRLSTYDQFGAIWKLDSRHIVCKTYIFINSNLFSYKNWNSSEQSLTQLLTLQKIVDISKIKGVLYQKLYFLKLHMSLYVHTKFQVSSLILTRFRQGVNLPHPPTTKRNPKKTTQSFHDLAIVIFARLYL